MDVREEQPFTASLILAVHQNGEEDASVDSAVTPLLFFSVFIAACGYFAFGTAAGYSSPIQAVVMDELGLSIAEFSLFGSMLTVGGLLGSLASGKITDLIGRRGAMGLSDTLGLLGWITISISQEAWSLDLGRSLVGASMGITLYVVPVYIAEITPKNLRGQFVFLSQLLASTGTVVMYFAGSLIPWRILVLIGIVPSLMQLLGIFLILESPMYLEFNEHLEQIPGVSLLGLFQRRYAHALIVVFGLMAISGIAGPSGLTYYASSVYGSAGFSSSIGPIVMALIQLPSIAIGVYMIDRCGRRPLIMISTAAMSICCFLVAFMFLMKENNCLQSISPYSIVLGLWGFSAAYSLGMAMIPFVLMSEIFPMNVKGSAGSVAAVVYGLSFWVSSYTFNFMTEWSYTGTFFIIGGLNALTVLFAARLMPETKGKTLEEIQVLFTPQ